MSEMSKFIVPPMCPDRVICQWHFEGGGFVALISFGKHTTAEMIDAIQQMIDLKKKEIADRLASDFRASQINVESDPVVTPGSSEADPQ